MTRLGIHFRKRHAVAGLTFADSLIAAMVAVTALGGFYASTQQAGRILRTGREIAQASEMLQQRIEALRYAPPWSNITTAFGIKSVTAGETGIAANFRNVTETFTVSGYPSGSQLVVTRYPDGTFADNAVDLSSTNCVKVTVTAKWTGTGNMQRSRQLSTIMSKGGL